MNKRFALTAALTVALTIATVVGAEPNAPAGVAQAATSQATVTGKTLPAPVMTPQAWMEQAARIRTASRADTAPQISVAGGKRPVNPSFAS